ncbi:MAG: ABC transporter ATP-binding protein [Propionibacteriaceae bacterium]|nr:ABC transporter ATP-binding protein [Propionibacteriaceae bacterium]
MRTPGNGTAGRLTITGVQKVFGDQVAIDDLDLVVEPGEFVSLLGPSGCGKTTLLRMIAGFEEPTRGRIRLGGEDLVGTPPFRRPVNTVFQSYALFPHMTVTDNIAYGPRQAKVPRREIADRVREALALVRMETFADRRPEQLSGGQQQRIALARAVVNRPQVLLLDEPMSALDRKLREDMQLELKRLHQDLGITFVFVTHDQEEALAMSDRIAVMEGGRIRQLGTAGEVYSSPSCRFVAGFIGRQNFVPVHEDDRGVLVSQEGEIRFLPGGAGTSQAWQGEELVVAVRPEAVTLRRTEAGQEPQDAEVNTVAGRVQAVSFLGDVVQHLVRTVGGHELLVRGSAYSSETVPEGGTVLLSWRDDAVQVFGDD